MTRTAKALVAELVGTAALVFAGCGAIMVNSQSGGALRHGGIAACFGLVIMVMIAALGPVSGAHFNPAVTIAFWAARRFPSHLVGPYLAAQVLGATAAALFLRASLGDIAGLGATVPSGSISQSFVWETVLTLLLVLVILGVATGAFEVGVPAEIAIGGTVALDALFGGPISGASMNPARSLGPALAGGPTTGLWLYLVAPVLGGLLALALFTLLRPVRAPASEADPA